jgi:hypothetical protein
MFNEASASLGGDVREDVKIEKPKTRAERLAAWKKGVSTEYKACKDAICNCSPSRAQMLLVDQYEGRANPPID